MTLSLLRRYNPIPPIRRLLSPTAEVAVKDAAAECPQVPEGTAPVERCMHCDRLIVLHLDSEGNGTVTCRPG